MPRGDGLTSQLQRFLVGSYVLSNDVPLSAAAALSPAQPPVGAVRLSPLAAAEPTAADVALLKPGSLRDVWQAVIRLGHLPALLCDRGVAEEHLGGVNRFVTVTADRLHDGC